MSKNQSPIFPLRLPPDLRQWLKDTAARNRRPMNSEVILMIEAERDRQQSTTEEQRS